MPFTVPSAGKVAGVSTGLTTDLNNLYGAAGTLATFNVLNAAYAGGADPTGVADSGAAFQAALNAAVTAGAGRVYIPAGTYNCATAVSKDFNTTCVRVAGDGRGATKINWTGTGTCLTLFDSSTSSFFGRRNGSGLTGITFDGTSAGASSTLVQISDFFQFDIDVAVSGGTGTSNCAGVRFINQVFFSEQLRGVIFTFNCNPGVVFDVASAGTTAGGSYDRAVLDIFVSQITPSFDGVVFQNGAFMNDARLGIYGNFVSSASALTSAVLRITGNAPAGHPASQAQITSSVLNMGLEVDGGLAHSPQTIVFGAVGSVSGCSGLLDFSQGGGVFAASNAFGQFQYQGTVIGDAALPTTTYYGEFTQAASNGSTVSARLGNVVVETNAGAVTGNIIQTGQYGGQILVVVVKGTGSMTFAASGTSNVAAGVGAVIAANTSRQFVWDSVSSLWY